MDYNHHKHSRRPIRSTKRSVEELHQIAAPVVAQLERIFPMMQKKGLKK